MRFAFVLAAMAALWALPAGAVTILLNAPDPTMGVHQKITVTGLGAGNVLKAGASGDPTGYWTQLLPGGQIYTDGNSIGVFGCETTGGSCENAYAFEAVDFPAKIIGYLSIKIVSDGVLVDWAKVANMACANQPPYNHPNFCGFAWEHNFGPVSLALNLDVLGPATNWNYSVETLGTFAVPVESEPPLGVPEPATWALMIIGIALAGMAMRRRHVMVTEF